MKKPLYLFCAVALYLSLLSPALAVDSRVKETSYEKQYLQTFSDVPTSHWAFSFIAELVERGAISGYPDGKFYPDKTVTREEFAKIMVITARLAPPSAHVSSFADVPLGR